MDLSFSPTRHLLFSRVSVGVGPHSPTLLPLTAQPPEDPDTRGVPSVEDTREPNHRPSTHKTLTLLLGNTHTHTSHSRTCR